MHNLNKTATMGFGHFSPSSALKMNNLGVITNYKKTEGINDQSKGSFRKWTGMPATTRNDRDKIPSLTLNQTKIIEEHRKKPTVVFPPDDRYTAFDSALGSREASRNIS